MFVDLLISDCKLQDITRKRNFEKIAESQNLELHGIACTDNRKGELSLKNNINHIIF